AEIDYSASGNFTHGATNDGILIEGPGDYFIQSTLAASTTKVVGGAGNDTFTVTSASGNVTSGIAGMLTIDALTGANNRLIVDTPGSTTAGPSITRGLNTTTALNSIAGTGRATTTEIDSTASGGGTFADATANANDGILVKGEQPTSGAGDTFNIQNT